jgi:hypothetical protein
LAPELGNTKPSWLMLLSARSLETRKPPKQEAVVLFTPVKHQTVNRGLGIHEHRWVSIEPYIQETPRFLFQGFALCNIVVTISFKEGT